MTPRLLAALLLLPVVIAVACPWPRHGAVAQTPPVVGLDVDTAGNTATSLGHIDSCTRVHAGDQFDVDVYVKDMPPIDGVQVTVRYDPQLLRPVSSDVKLFLNVKAGSSVSELQKPAQDPGAYLIAGFDFGQDSAESGSGAAIRIVFEALAAGTSDLRATDVLMSDAGGAAVQPAGAGGQFTGTVTGGVVAIDAVCGAGPEPSPQASNTPAPTSEPSAVASTGTAVPSALAGTPSPAGSATARAASTASALTPGAASTGAAAGTQAASTGAAATAAAGATTGAAAEPTFRTEARAASKTPGRGGDSDAAAAEGRTGGDGFSPLWWLPIGAAALLLAAAVAWRRYARRREPRA